MTWFKKEPPIPNASKAKPALSLFESPPDHALLTRLQRKRIFWSVFSAHGALALACVLSGWVHQNETTPKVLINAQILPLNTHTPPVNLTELPREDPTPTPPKPKPKPKPTPKPKPKPKLKTKPTPKPKPKPKPRPEQESRLEPVSTQTRTTPPRTTSNSTQNAIATAADNQKWEGDMLKPYVMARFLPLAPSRFDLNGETPQCTVQITINANGGIMRMAFTEPCPSPALENAIKTLFEQMKTVPKKEKGPFPYTTTITFQVE